MSAATSKPSPPENAAAQEAQPAGGSHRTPLAFVIDEETSIRQFVSLLLQGSGVDTAEFSDGNALIKAAPARTPDLVFLNVNLEIQEALQTVEALGRAGFSGAVQLMSGRGAAVLETVRQAGERRGLRMLPALKKPFETAAIQKILNELKLGLPPPAQVKISLAEALKNSWVEFWYQPKIDLRKKQLAGAEAFARVRHPQHGILLPGSFMPEADEASVVQLAEQSLIGALKSGLNLSRLGVNLRIAVNMPVTAVTKLPFGDIVRAHRPQANNWPGIIIDVTEEQIVNDIALANDLAKKLAEHNLKLAIDDFGNGYSSLMKLKEVPFAEMKLDRAFVNGCGSDKVNAPICKTVIDLAHSFGSLAVGVGLERAPDAQALVSMGCDIGQGYLFGQPMPEERFISLLKQRATVRSAGAGTETEAPASAAAQPA